MGIGAKGNSTTEALNRKVELDEAVKRGNTDAMIEIGTEMMTGGLNIFGKGALDDIVQNGIVKKVENEVGRFLVQQGVNLGGEVLEETISDILGTILDKGTTDPNATYSWKDWGKTAVTTMLSTLALNILTGGMVGDIRKAQNRTQLRDVVNNSNLTESQKDNLGSKIQDERISNQEELSNEVQKLKAIENSGLDEERQASLLRFSDKNNLNVQQIQDLVKADQERYGVEQTIPLENKTSQNETSNELEGKEPSNLFESLNQSNKTAQKGQSVIDYENNKSIKDNIQRIQDFLDERQIKGKFDRTLFEETDKNGKVVNNGVNAFYEYDKNGKIANIVFNPESDSSKYLENIALHEMYHSFSNYNKEGEDKSYQNIIKDMILDNDTRNEEYDKAYKELYDLYAPKYMEQLIRNHPDYTDEEIIDKAKEMVDEEVVANILGNELGNQEFLNELNNGKYAKKEGFQKVIQSIKDFIENMINKVTGNEQKTYWKNVKRMFDEAYRNSDINRGGIQNSIEAKMTDTTDSNGRNLSEGQVDYFKNSENRNEKNELKTMYRGSPVEVNIFEKNGKGKRYTNFGAEYETDIKGFFFTENEDYAKEFGNTIEYYLNTEKILKLNENTDDLNKIFRPMLDEMLKNQDITQTQYDAIIENGTTYQRFIDEDGVDWQTIDEDAFNESIKILRDLGYDSIEVNEGNGEKSIMIFESNQAKRTDNLNPTTDNDIRYSKDTESIDFPEKKEYNKYHTDTLDEKVRLRSGSTLQKFVLAYDNGNYYGIINKDYGEYTILEVADANDTEKVQKLKEKFDGIGEYLYANGYRENANGLSDESQNTRRSNESNNNDIIGEQSGTESINTISEKQREINRRGNSSESIRNKRITTNKKAYESKAKEGTIRLYTNTKAENIDSILNEGLKFDKSRELEYEGKATWFETTPDLKGYGGTTIAVDVPVNSKMEKVNNTQYMVYEDLSPENIVFVDKPIFNNYRTSDIENLVDRFGKDKVLDVFDKSKNQYISRDELVDMINENSEESSFSMPKNVKEIKNMSEFLRKAYEQETNKEWKNRLYDAKTANYTRLDNRRSPLKYKREIVQQYLDYKNGVNDSSDVQYSIDTESGNNTDNIDSTDLSPEEIINAVKEQSQKKTKNTLLAIHNLTAEKLRGILELGGFPVPSIAITNQAHTQFGDISIIFDKSTIDPSRIENEVYDRDVWSPTFPQVDYEINEDLSKASKELGLERWQLRDYAEDSSKPEYLIDKLSRTEEVVDKFIKDNNLKYETKYQEAKLTKWYNEQDSVKKFISENKLNIEEFINNKDIREQYYETLRNEFNKDNDEVEAINKQIEHLEYWANNDRQRLRESTLARDFDVLNGETQVVDDYETKKEKRKVAEENGIKKYLEAQMKNIYGEKGIYNGKDYVTENGRRTFWQLHDEYNLENIVEALTKKATKGTQDWIAGYGQIQAQMAKQFSSISDIKSNEGLLTNLSDNNELLTEARDNIESDIDEIVDNNDTDHSVVSELLADFASGDLTIENFRDLTNRYYQSSRNVSDKLIKKIIKDLNNLKNLPTDYFEAKPQRAVGLDEIKAIVLPSNIDADLKQQLQDSGMRIIEYNRDVEGDREAKLMSAELDDLRFSRDTTGAWNAYMNKYHKQKGTGTSIKDMKTMLPERVITMKDYNDILDKSINIPDEDKKDLRADIKNAEMSKKGLDDFRKYVENLDKKYSQTQEKSKSLPSWDNIGEVFEQTTEQVESPLQDRDIQTIGKETKKNAYQYDNPEVKPYFQEMAQMMGEDLANISDSVNRKTKKGGGTELRYNTKAINDLHNKYGYSYEQIGIGLNNIIEDSGAENNAVSKKLEFYIDEALREGYRNVYGKMVAPNQDYINTIQYSMETEENNNPSRIDLETDEDVQAFREATASIGKIVPIEEQIQDINEGKTQLPETRDRIVDKKSLPKREKGDLKRDFIKQFVNKDVAVDELAKKTGNKALIWKNDRRHLAFGEAQYAIGENQTNVRGEIVGDSLVSIYNQAEKSGIVQKDFDDYLLHRTNIERSKYEKGLFGESITAKDSERLVEAYEKKYSNIKELGEKISHYNDENLKVLRDGGFISEDLYSKLRQMYENYVPAIADIVEDQVFEEYDNVGFQQLKRAVGNNENILSPKQSIASQTLKYRQAYRNNEVLKEIYKATKSDVKELYNAGEIADPSQAQLEIDHAVGYDEVKKKYTATIFENGNYKIFEISKDIYEAFKPNKYIEGIEEAKFFNKVLGKTAKASQGFKALTTGKNILYALKNMVRDLNDAPINSTTNVANFYAHWFKAYKEIATKGELYQEYKRAGGGANTYFDYNEGMLPTKQNIAQKFLSKVEAINEVVETAPRLAEYMLTKERGGSIEEALYNSAEVTTNFKRGGEFTKAMDKYAVPFLNASVQGLDKQIRNLTGQNGVKGYANLVVNSLVAGILPSVLNHMLLDDDDEYEKLPDYLKDNYYLIKTNDKEQNFIRIPKGRVAGMLGASAVRTMRLVHGDDRAFDDYFSEVIWNNIGVNNPITNNLFAPLVQASQNKAWFSGNIYSESKYKNKLPVEIQDEKTDMFSRWVGETLYNVLPEKMYKNLVDDEKGSSLFKVLATPKLLNYVLDQYTGFIGDFALPMMTPFAENNPITDQFTTSSVLKDKVVSEFYDIMNNTYANSEFATDTDKLTNKYLTGVSKETGALYKEKAEIQNDPNLSDKEKREKSYEIQRQINDKMKEAVDKVNELKINGNTASFDGTEYYKDKDDKWQELKEEDKVEGVSTSVLTEFKNELSSANKKKNDSEGKDLKDSEKIQMLKNKALSNEEKDVLYSKVIKKDDKAYNGFKYISGTEKIDDYLDYKTQDFTSEEDPNSSIVGKRVTKGDGTKKNKIINYFANSNFSDLEKLYLYGQEYKLPSENNKRSKITNEIGVKTSREEFQRLLNEQNLTAEQKREILLNLNGVVEIKDGSIAWE